MSPDSQPVSRLPALAEPLDPPVTAIFDGIRQRGNRVLNVHRASAHAPKVLQAHSSFAAALRNELSLPRPLSELIILRISQIEDADYQWGAHLRMAREQGLAAEKIEALGSWRSSSVFDRKERAALAYAEEVTRDGRVSKATFVEIEDVFDPQKIVELTALASYYAGNSRYVKALGIKRDDADER
jgi:alkylhydroperoxidase family enzyme